MAKGVNKSPPLFYTIFHYFRKKTPPPYRWIFVDLDRVSLFVFSLFPESSGLTCTHLAYFRKESGNRGGEVFPCVTNIYLAPGLETGRICVRLWDKSTSCRIHYFRPYSRSSLGVHFNLYNFGIRENPLSGLINFINFIKVIRLGRLINFAVGVHFFALALSQEPDRSIDRKRGRKSVKLCLRR